MKYFLKIIPPSAYVIGEGYIHAMVDFTTPSVGLYNKQAQLVVPNLSVLFSVIRKLQLQFADGNSESQKGQPDQRNLGNEIKIEEGELRFAVGVDPIRAITRLIKLCNKIEPLLELADAICTGLQSKPVNTWATVECWPGPIVIEGMPVEQWLAVRKNVALEIEPTTAKVRVQEAQPGEHDPYLIDPVKYLIGGQDYFARSPNSDVWVWFGDLPRRTERALAKTHDVSWVTEHRNFRNYCKH